jgi:hypothetical protein
VVGVVRCRFERVSAPPDPTGAIEMNRRDIVVCLLWSAALLGRVHAQQTGKVYQVAVIGPTEQAT